MKIKQKQPLVSVIIVGYNAKHFLAECLGSLVNGLYKNIEILYIDNGSKDGTSAYITKYYPQIRLFKNEKNLGFSPAHEGILEETRGEAILILNTDTILDKNLLKVLFNTLYS
jgi:GT2 family glycosyltransferase